MSAEMFVFWLLACCAAASGIRLLVVTYRDECFGHEELDANRAAHDAEARQRAADLERYDTATIRHLRDDLRRWQIAAAELTRQLEQHGLTPRVTLIALHDDAADLIFLTDPATSDLILRTRPRATRTH